MSHANRPEANACRAASAHSPARPRRGVGLDQPTRNALSQSPRPQRPRPVLCRLTAHPSRTDPCADEGLAGLFFLIMVASLLRLASEAAPGEMVFVCVGLLLYTTPAIFVSIYRGDQIEHTSDVNYAPLQLAKERVAKEVWAVVVTMTPGHNAPLIAVIVLAALLLLFLAHPSQYSSTVVVRVRRVLLASALWIAVCALFVANGLGAAGRILLLTGLSLMLLLGVLAAFIPKARRWLAARNALASKDTAGSNEMALPTVPGAPGSCSVVRIYDSAGNMETSLSRNI